MCLLLGICLLPKGRQNNFFAAVEEWSNYWLRDKEKKLYTSGLVGSEGGEIKHIFGLKVRNPVWKQLKKQTCHLASVCLHTENTCMRHSVASALTFQTTAPPEVCRRAGQAEVEEIQRRVFLKVYITQTPQWSKNTVIIEVRSVRFCQNTRRQMAKLHRNTLASSVCVCVLGRIICMFIAVSVCLWDRGKFPYLSLWVCVYVRVCVYVNITVETVPFSGWVETQVSGLVLKLNVADWSGSEY